MEENEEDNISFDLYEQIVNSIGANSPPHPSRWTTAYATANEIMAWIDANVAIRRK